MKVTFIVGNGFDINMGIDTKYSDFYKWFLVQEESKNIPSNIDSNTHRQLVEIMGKKNLPYWADLEELFGKEIRNFQNIDLVKSAKEYLEVRLNTYLELQQKRVKIINENGKELKEQLDNFIIQFIDLSGRYSKNEQYTVSFLSFNYTDIIDRIIETTKNTLESNCVYCLPKHIHGLIGKTLILGVDSEEQYEYNVSTIEECEDLNKSMLKPILNSLTRGKEVEDILNHINESDLIILYGASIGGTDAFWWRKIGDWLKEKAERKLVIIGFIDSSYAVSGTCQLALDKYKNRFIQFSSCNKQVEGRILVSKTEDWMFKFDNSVISVRKKGIFDNLIMS